MSDVMLFLSCVLVYTNSNSFTFFDYSILYIPKYKCESSLQQALRHGALHSLYITYRNRELCYLCLMNEILRCYDSPRLHTLGWGDMCMLHWPSKVKEGGSSLSSSECECVCVVVLHMASQPAACPMIQRTQAAWRALSLTLLYSSC